MQKETILETVVRERIAVQRQNYQKPMNVKTLFQRTNRSTKSCLFHMSFSTSLATDLIVVECRIAFDSSNAPLKKEANYEHFYWSV